MELCLGAFQVPLNAGELCLGVVVCFCALNEFSRPPLAQLRHSTNFFHFGCYVSLKLADALGLALNLELKTTVAVSRHENT